MNKIIRWPGLIGFLVIVGTISAVLILFLDTWIKIAAQSGLEQVTGAEVNIAEVSHTFSPFGITLRQIQLTDPKSPQLNQVQAESLSAQIDLAPLLLNKVIIDELTMTGVAFSQPRASEGAVYRDTGETDGNSFTEQLAENAPIPSVDEILARSPLKTTVAIEQAQLSYDKHSATLKQQYDALPNKEAMQEYKTRIKALTETDYKNPVELAAAKKEFDQIREELKKDKQKLTDFKQAASEAKQDLAPKIANLKAAPGEDYDQLKRLIAGDQGAIEDVTRMILGDKAAVWSDYLLSAYKIAAPMMQSSAEQEAKQQRNSGRNIAFSDEAELPDVWIKKADISLSWQQEVIASNWQDITHQHEKIGKPTRFNIDSAASSLWQSLKVEGDFRIAGQAVSANQKWDLKGIKLDDLALLDQEKMSTKIQHALLASSGALKVENGVMDGAGDIDLSQLSMTAMGSNNFTKVIAETLAGLNALKIKTKLSGEFNDPSVSFSSDLDKKLAQAALQNLSGDQTSKLGELKSKLNAKAQGALGEKNGQLDQWLDWEKLADGNLGSIEDMLGAQFNSVLDKEKDKLKDKLKNKLFGN